MHVTLRTGAELTTGKGSFKRDEWIKDLKDFFNQKTQRVSILKVQKVVAKHIREGMTFEHFIDSIGLSMAQEFLRDINIFVDVIEEITGEKIVAEVLEILNKYLETKEVIPERKRTELPEARIVLRKK